MIDLNISSKETFVYWDFPHILSRKLLFPYWRIDLCFFWNMTSSLIGVQLHEPFLVIIVNYLFDEWPGVPFLFKYIYRTYELFCQGSWGSVGTYLLYVHVTKKRMYL